MLGLVKVDDIGKDVVGDGDFAVDPIDNGRLVLGHIMVKEKSMAIIKPLCQICVSSPLASYVIL